MCMSLKASLIISVTFKAVWPFVVLSFRVAVLERDQSDICSPSLWIHSDGPWFAQISVDQHTSPSAIRWSHRDGSVTRIGPVEVVLDPVQCQPLRGMKIWVDQSNVSRRVARLVDISTAKTCRQLEVLLLDTWVDKSNQMNSVVTVLYIMTEWRKILCPQTFIDIHFVKHVTGKYIQSYASVNKVNLEHCRN